MKKNINIFIIKKKLKLKKNYEHFYEKIFIQNINDMQVKQQTEFATIFVCQFMRIHVLPVLTD